MHNKIFQNFLGKKRLKMTRERFAILEEIYSAKGHFEPEKLYDRIRVSGLKASRASVYRTLSLLVESGLVEKVSRTGKGNIYERSYGGHHHDHMICEVCGEIIEFYSEDLERIQNEVCKKNSFRGTTHTLEIRGHCEHCRD